MPQPSACSHETIDLLTRSLETALELLRHGRYPELDEHFRGFAHQAQGLAALKRALEDGAPPQGIRESCQRLGRSLLVFSEVARQVATVETGMVQWLAGPGEGAYGRNGHSNGCGGYQFEQEA